MSNPHPLESIDKICIECNREFTGIIAVCPHDNAPLIVKTVDPLIGTIMGEKYQVLAAVGGGSMGVVYKARDALIDRIVAIKVLHAQHVSDSIHVKRFRYEATAASRLDHPHVITTYDFGISTTGQPFLVMDFIEGSSLADILERDRNLPVERALKILIQACDALGHAHKHGVLHRDVKPSNIVLSDFEGQTDFVRVVDFGMAKLLGANQEGQRLTQAGDVCGSPIYMSPEQCTGSDLDRRSDVYSLGVVLYETLTGVLPLCGKTLVETMTKHLNEMPPRFNIVRPDLYIPERLEAVVFKALAKNPDNRQHSMEQLTAELQFALPRPDRSDVVRTMPPEAYELPNQTDRKQPPRLVLVLVAAVIVVVVGGGVTLLAVNRPSQVHPSAPATTTALPPVGKSLAAPAQLPSTVAGSASRADPSPDHRSANPVEPPAGNSTAGNQAAADPRAGKVSSQNPAVANPTAAIPEAGSPAGALPTQDKIKHALPVHRPAQIVHRRPVPAVPHQAPAPPAASNGDPFSELRSKHSRNQ